MVEQICEKCGVRYSMYAPNCPACGAPSAQPPKKPGCPQAPAPAPQPAKPAAKEPSEQVASASENTDLQACSAITVEGKSKCPCRDFLTNPFALIGIFVAVFGALKLLKK